MRGRILLLVFTALIVFVGVVFVIGIATTGDPGVPSPSASLEDLREREVMFFEEHRVFLVYNDGEPLALSDDAQHLGDRVEFCPSSHMFEARSHGEKFDIRGYYYSGPAQRGLDRYRIRIEDGRISVDLDQIIQGPERGEGPPREPQGPLCVAS